MAVSMVSIACIKIYTAVRCCDFPIGGDLDIKSFSVISENELENKDRQYERGQL